MGHVDLNNPEWKCICCGHAARYHRRLPPLTHIPTPNNWEDQYCNYTLGMTAGTGSGRSDTHCGCAKYIPESNFAMLKRIRNEQRTTV
jgi:hypothetical protein